MSVKAGSGSPSCDTAQCERQELKHDNDNGTIFLIGIKLTSLGFFKIITSKLFNIIVRLCQNSISCCLFLLLKSLFSGHLYYSR